MPPAVSTMVARKYAILRVMAPEPTEVAKADEENRK
jgi:hypothetical protein